MSMKTFAGLCLAAVVALVLATVAVLQQPRLQTSDRQGEMVFPNFVKDADRLKTIVIRHGEDSVSLDWDGKVWHERDRGNYPADSEKATNLIIALARMAKIEGKTKLPERYNRLEVEDPTAKDTKAREISLIDAAGKDIAKLIVGKRQFGLGESGGEGGTYVRLPGDPQVWLVTGQLPPETAVADWLKKDIVDINAGAVSCVTVTQPTGEKIVVGRDSQMSQNFIVENLPKGTAPPANQTADEYGRLLSTMVLQDVAPAASKPFPKDKTITAVIEGVTGFLVTMDVADIDGQSWLKIKGTPAPSSDMSKPGESKMVDLRTDWTKVMNELNARADGWVFEVPAYQVAPLKHHMEELLKPAPRTSPTGLPPTGL